MSGEATREENLLPAEWNELGAALLQECKKLARNPKEEDKGCGAHICHHDCEHSL